MTTTTKTFILDGATPGGIITTIYFEPRGQTVLVTTRHPRLAPHSCEMPLERARQYFRETLALGCYKRIA